MIVYLVEQTDWESMDQKVLHSVWSSKDKAEEEICRLRKLRTFGRLVYPKKRYSLYVVEYDLDPAT